MGLDLDGMLEDLGKAKEGSVFVLHTYVSSGMSHRLSLLHHGPACTRRHVPCLTAALRAAARVEACVGNGAYEMCMQWSVTAGASATRF
jgi:hypothetical protein